MRSWAALAVKLFVSICLASVLPGVVLADTIYLKNGKKISASHVVQENGQISYETSAGRLSLPASIVDKVVREVESVNSASGTPIDKAANLPIAPPNEFTRSSHDEITPATVPHASTHNPFLIKLESQAH